MPSKDIAQRAKEAMIAIAKAIPPEAMQKLGLSTPAMTSPRSVEFRLEKPAAQGINRVRVSKDGDAFLVRFYRIEEVEIAYAVPPGNLQSAITTILEAA